MIIRHFLAISLILASSCKQSKLSSIEVIKFNPKIIDSLKQASDTSYTEIIGRSDFYTADYYISKRDSITTKILKDSLGHVVAVNKSKNRQTLFAAEYYTNGQLIGQTKFISGKIDGPALYYYANGRTRSIGQWHDFKQSGTWKDYDEQGRLEKITHYNDDGKIIKTELYGKE
jgi:antitoxin component YwqK of YwqJK toxin-antitoxin module